MRAKMAAKPGSTRALVQKSMRAMSQRSHVDKKAKDKDVGRMFA